MSAGASLGQSLAGHWLLWCDAQSDVVGQAAGEDEPAFLLSGRRLGQPEL